MNTTHTPDVSSVLASLLRQPVDPTTAELVIDRYDQWTDRTDTALFPTACATRRVAASSPVR